MRPLWGVGKLRTPARDNGGRPDLPTCLTAFSQLLRGEYRKKSAHCLAPYDSSLKRRWFSAWSPSMHFVILHPW